MGVTPIGTLFGDNSDANDPLAEDGNTIKSRATKSHFIWDHGRHEWHFMHGFIQIPELYIYVWSWLFHRFLYHRT